MRDARGARTDLPGAPAGPAMAHRPPAHIGWGLTRGLSGPHDLTGKRRHLIHSLLLPQTEVGLK